MSFDLVVLIVLILLAALNALVAVKTVAWAVRRYRRGAPARALARQRRQVARVNELSAEYVAAKNDRPAAVAEELTGRCRPTRHDRRGMGDLPRPIYPARQTVWLDGDMSKTAKSWAPVSRTCAWSLEPCTDDVASDLGYCVRHMRRVLGASTPEVTP